MILNKDRRKLHRLLSKVSLERNLRLSRIEEGEEDEDVQVVEGLEARHGQAEQDYDDENSNLQPNERQYAKVVTEMDSQDIDDEIEDRNFCYSENWESETKRKPKQNNQGLHLDDVEEFGFENDDELQNDGILQRKEFSTSDYNELQNNTREYGSIDDDGHEIQNDGNKFGSEDDDDEMQNDENVSGSDENDDEKGNDRKEPGSDDDGKQNDGRESGSDDGADDDKQNKRKESGSDDADEQEICIDRADEKLYEDDGFFHIERHPSHDNSGAAAPSPVSSEDWDIVYMDEGNEESEYSKPLTAWELYVRYDGNRRVFLRPKRKIDLSENEDDDNRVPMQSTKSERSSEYENTPMIASTSQSRLQRLSSRSALRIESVLSLKISKSQSKNFTLGQSKNFEAFKPTSSKTWRNFWGLFNRSGNGNSNDEEREQENNNFTEQELNCYQCTLSLDKDSNRETGEEVKESEVSDQQHIPVYELISHEAHNLTESEPTSCETKHSVLPQNSVTEMLTDEGVLTENITLKLKEKDESLENKSYGQSSWMEAIDWRMKEDMRKKFKLSMRPEKSRTSSTENEKIYYSADEFLRFHKKSFDRTESQKKITDMETFVKNKQNYLQKGRVGPVEFILPHKDEIEPNESISKEDLSLFRHGHRPKPKVLKYEIKMPQSVIANFSVGSLIDRAITVYERDYGIKVPEKKIKPSWKTVLKNFIYNPFERSSTPKEMKLENMENNDDDKISCFESLRRSIRYRWNQLIRKTESEESTEATESEVVDEVESSDDSTDSTESSEYESENISLKSLPELRNKPKIMIENVTKHVETMPVFPTSDKVVTKRGWKIRKSRKVVPVW